VNTEHSVTKAQLTVDVLGNISDNKPLTAVLNEIIGCHSEMLPHYLVREAEALEASAGHE